MVLLLGSMVCATLVDQRLLGLAFVASDLDVVVALSQHMLLLLLPLLVDYYTLLLLIG